MTPGLSTDMSVTHDHTLFYVCESLDQTSDQITWAVSLVIADGHLMFLSMYLRINIVTLLQPKGTSKVICLKPLHCSDPYLIFVIDT